MLRSKSVIDELEAWVIKEYAQALLSGRVKPSVNIDHPLRVANSALHHSDRVVALLHDTLEDGIISMEDFAVLSLLMRDAVLTEDEINAVLLLTRDKEKQTYQEYIDTIIGSGNKIAMRVKVLDLLDHLRPWRFFNPKSPSHRKRYIKSLAKLSEALS